MTRTVWMKVLYILLLIISAFFSVLYLGPFSVLLLCILIILPIFLWISLFYIRFNLNVSIKTTGSTYHRNKPQAIQLIVKNKGFLPVGKAAALVICRSQITEEQVPVVLTFPIPARNITTAEFTITVPHCGLTEICLQKLQFTDYIRLFSYKMRVPADASVLILPSGKELNYKLEVPCSITDEESNIYSKLRAGDDPSEVYRIREYQPGDMQKRIHWKLSCRTDTVWVKEYSLPIKQRAAILIDYSAANISSVDVMDTALEAAYSLASAFIRQDVPAVLYWINSESQQLVWNELHSISELNDCFISLLSKPPCTRSDELVSQASEQLDIHSTNAIYYCTPQFDAKAIEKLYGIFQKNHLYILTAQFPMENSKVKENIIFIREKSIAEDLRKLSAAEVRRE